jgi:hypothetical protein
MIAVLEPTAVVVAIIASVPGTLAALAAWRSAHKANVAVNDRPSSAPTISTDVSEIRKGVDGLNTQVKVLRERLDDHLTRHHGPRRRW